MAHLYQTIVSLRQRSAIGLHFISYPSLRHAIHRALLAPSIEQICIQQPHRKTHVTDTILHSGLKVFAILVLLGQEPLILDFIEALGDDIDKGLPFEQVQIDRISRDVSSRFCSEVQWELIPHSFARNGFHRRIGEQVIIPFTAERRFDEGSGGEIFECTLANGQHNFAAQEVSSSTPLKVIKKRIKMVRSSKESKAQAFKKELECLEILRCIRHSNIIELLASYEQYGDYFLLFPRLAMNLADFLALDERHEDFKDDLTFFNALRGLSSAVSELHELSVAQEELVVKRIGYHHDIKLKNVLVTKNTFVLTDFGLARLQMPDEGSESQWSNTIGDYIAPECMDDRFHPNIVGRSIDVWALGCFIADVATYMELGREGLQQYRQKRIETVWPQMPRNYRFFEKDALRSSVIDWLNAMSDDGKVPGLAFLVELVALTLQVDPKVRPKASEVHQRLQYVSAKMLYRKIVHELEIKGETVREVYEEPSSYAHVEFWLELEKLRAWGYVLGMESQGTIHDLFLHHPAIATAIHDFLQDYIQSSETTLDENLDVLLATNPISKQECELIKRLWGALPIPYQVLIEQTWRRTFLDTDDLPRLFVVEQAAQVLPKPYSQIGRNAALKRLSLKIWEELPEQSPQQRALIVKIRQLDRDHKLSETHEIGWLDEIGDVQSEPKRLRVFIEWLMFSPSWEKQSEKEKILKTLALAEMLSNPKPDTFRVLDCVGVAPPGEDPNHPGFAYIYRFPTHIQDEQHTRICTLTDVLQEKISLEHKFGIASRLCTSIYHLHSAGWLHKNLKASNIIFFVEDVSGTKIVCSTSLDPYLVGFQHSRPNGEVWQSDYDVYSGVPSDYRHPNYTPGSSSFYKRFDYYSLGVLLLEIGFWMPIASFRAKHHNVSKHDFKDLLAERYAPQLSLRMGSLYADIVVTCLLGHFGEAVSQDETALIDMFFWKVVTPLTEMRIA